MGVSKLCMNITVHEYIILVTKNITIGSLLKRLTNSKWETKRKRSKQKQNSRHKSISLLLLLSCIIVSGQIVNSVCWSHALVNGPTSKMPASGGGLCSGQLLMMWSAVCSGSPHSHAALSASPHFFMDALYRPTPVRSRFRVVHCFRLRFVP